MHPFSPALVLLSFPAPSTAPFANDPAGRAVPEPGPGVRTGDGVQRGEDVPQEQANAAGAPREAVPLPARQGSRAHPRPRHLPSRYQAAESAARSTGGWSASGVERWLCELRARQQPRPPPPRRQYNRSVYIQILAYL